MRTRSLPAVLLACALALGGCTPQPPAGPGPGGSATVPATTPGGPPGVDLDRAASVPLAVGPDGGRVTVASGDWTAMVAVPKGAAAAGATWTVTPLRSAPAGVPEALAPGVHVDEGGQPPSGDCLIAFSTTGTVDADATIVKLSADAASSEIVATDTQKVGMTTILMAEVSGFSMYGVGKGAKANRDAAKKKRKQAKPGRYAISVHDKVSFTVEDWKFSATLDLNLAGGGSTSAGPYQGNATLLFTGKYTKTLGGVIKGLGNIRYSGKGKATAYLYGDLAPLVPLDDNNLPYQMDDVSGTGDATIKGSGGLDMLAKAPLGTYQAPGIKVKDGVKFPYRINVDGDKVTVEIANLGEFSGNLVRF